jgi:mannose-6-phosphate isomerase-like protein (cupin superfamily)
MKARISKALEQNEYFFKEGCFILELSNSESDPDLSIARARVEPGTATRLHHLKTSLERYVIVSGTGTVEIGGLKPQQVAAGDVVMIPPLTSQRIQNTGRTDLVFLSICTPRFQMSEYVEVE